MTGLAHRSTDEREWLDAAAWERLGKRVAVALRAVRSVPQRVVVVSVTRELAENRDPSAIVASSRAPGEPWSSLEQPDRDHAALATLGSVAELSAEGPDRFAELATRWRELAATALSDPLAGPAGTGLVATGGFAFAPAGGSSPSWSGFSPGSLVVPEVSIARRGARVWLTINEAVATGDTQEDVEARVRRRIAGLRSAPLPMLDPAPVGTFQVHSPMPPSHYEEAVARAVERIARGEFEKLVLAREVRVNAPTDYDSSALLGVLRDGFPSCYVYAFGRGDATFLGATPELLIRRDGQRASTVALAGSTRRSADPAVDAHLGEQLLRSAKDRHENEIVARRIASALAPLSVWVTAAPDPVVVRVANIQHLAAPIRAQLATPVSAIELAGALHPTPAVGGEPRGPAMSMIPALEGLDRGWYAGAVGWSDSMGDGEFVVALRCALLRGRSAACYAGAGIVADSDPAAELAETEVKLQALLPVLSG